VVKFRGAGQGPKALVAEVIASELARAAGLPVPETAVITIGAGFGAGEPDPEIQDLLRGSAGKNFGVRYLSGAVGFDPVADRALLTPELAADIVWFDALVSNVDRTVRNPNILVWDRRLWLIDHGACFYFQYIEGNWHERTNERFPLIERHVLLPRAGDIYAAEARLSPRLAPGVVRAAVASVPHEWLGGESASLKEAYVAYLMDRLAGPRAWMEEAEVARRLV
jgi:hypothetical protein